MTTRRLVAALAAAAVLGCTPSAGDAPPAPPKRATLVPGPGVEGFRYAKDGRLVFSKLIDTKLAIFVSDADGRNAKRVSFGVWDYNPFVSPDGKWIAFMRDAGTHNDLYIVPSDSGAERVVAATRADEVLNDWLADGSGLLFTRGTSRGGESWAYMLADGTSAKQIEADGSVSAFPSPDGKWLVYTLTKDGKRTIWLQDRTRKTTRQLTTEGFEQVVQHCFSPDSRSLLYNSRRTGTSDIWRMDIATGERRQVTQDIAEDANGVWSPDGSRILFISNRGGQPDLWITTTGESDTQRVTDDAVAETGAEWRPDGRSVVASVALGLRHLYAVPLSGEGKEVALTSGDWSVESGDVSHDGRRVAYSGTKNGDPDIWVVPVAGGEPKLVSGAPGTDGNVDWSPDGTRVAFASVRSGNFDVWITPVDSGAAVRLTDWASSENVPKWSPDGKTIAFLSDRESGGRDLWTMPAAGGAATRITRTGTIDDNYNWSPDSRTIAFSALSDAGAGRATFVAPAAGGAARPFAPATSQFPQWRPDGREIKVLRCDRGFCAIDIWSAEGKRLRTLTTGTEVYEFSLLWSSDGSRAIVGWEDIKADGSNRMDIRSTADGSSKPVPFPAGFSVRALGFADGDRTAIVMAERNGTSLQRIDVPALATAVKR